MSWFAFSVGLSRKDKLILFGGSSGRLWGDAVGESFDILDIGLRTCNCGALFCEDFLKKEAGKVVWDELSGRLGPKRCYWVEELGEGSLLRMKSSCLLGLWLISGLFDGFS